MMYRLLLTSILLLVLTGCATSSKTSNQSVQPTNKVYKLSALADRAYKNNRWIEAALHYNKLTNLAPHDAYVWFRLGNTYTKQGFYPKAIVAFEKSIELNAEQPKPWFNLSTTYLLRAQAALKISWSQMKNDDPGKRFVATRLHMLEALMHSSVERPLQRASFQ